MRLRFGEAYGADGFDWTIQGGESAGQTVDHLHLHVIPRKRGDLPSPGDWYPRLRASESEAIDSELRPHLTDTELLDAVLRLRDAADRLGFPP